MQVVLMKKIYIKNSPSSNASFTKQTFAEKIKNFVSVFALDERDCFRSFYLSSLVVITQLSAIWLYSIKNEIIYFFRLKYKIYWQLFFCWLVKWKKNLIFIPVIEFKLFLMLNGENFSHNSINFDVGIYFIKLTTQIQIFYTFSLFLATCLNIWNNWII